MIKIEKTDTKTQMVVQGKGRSVGLEILAFIDNLCMNEDMMDLIIATYNSRDILIKEEHIKHYERLEPIIKLIENFLEKKRGENKDGKLT